MFRIIYLLALLALAWIKVEALEVDPDVGLDMEQIVTTRGYPIESYFVETSDGYILKMFRIPVGKGESRTETIRPVVILQHGLLDCSFTWVNNFEQQSLGYILADAGFDVWFGNNRGNRYGRNHTTLNPDDKSGKFWSFSWDEMAIIDVPTFINFVLSVTNAKSLAWIGHSEGTTQIFAAATVTKQFPHLESVISKINLFVALAPVTFATNQISKTLRLLAERDTAHKLLKAGVYEYSPWYEQVCNSLSCN